MTYAEDDYLMISGIQHFLFCQRQWALIHIEGQWAENRLTAEGQVIHKNAHNDSFLEKRPGLLITRSLRVASPTLGITGQCDVVEFHRSDDGAVLFGHRGYWKPVVVEYKHGTDKEDASDISQLACEIMCLEEMLGIDIPCGYLFYKEKQSRTKVEITSELRENVTAALNRMHELYKRRYTPKVKTSKKCNSCSLKDKCLPKLCKNISAANYVNSMLGEKIL